jgi:hypothetical protein
MIAMLLAELASSPVVLASSSGDGGATPWLLALGPAGAAGVYFGLWRYYRNTHQSHSYERETRIEAQPVTGTDAKVREITGTKKSGIDGDNRTNHRKRVQRIE